MSNIYYSTWKGDRSGYNYRLEITPASTTALAGVAGGAVIGATQTTLGTGYTSGTYAATGGTGAGYTVVVTTTTGAVLSITLLTGGSGCSGGHSVATTGGTGTGLFVDASESGGVINSIFVRTAGSGYTVGDIVTIVDGDNMATFSVDSVTTGAAIISSVVNNGYGYSVSDVLTIVGGNNDATVTVNSVQSSGDTYVEFPKGLLKMKTLKAFDYKDIPIGMPEATSLDYEVDIYGLSIHANTSINTELINSLLYPTLDTTVVGIPITLGTIHTLMIDKGNGVYITVYKGIQRLGAEQGLASDSDFISIESQSVERYAMNCISGRDIITAVYNGLGSSLTSVGNQDSKGIFVYELISYSPFNGRGIVEFLRMERSNYTNDYWYVDSPNNVLALYYLVLDQIMKKMVRLAAFTFDTSNNKLYNLVTYYKRRIFDALIPTVTNTRYTALDNTSDLRFPYLINTGLNSQDTFSNGLMFNDRCYGRVSIADYISDSANGHLRRVRSNYTGIECDSIIPPQCRDLGFAPDTKWSIKYGEKTYATIECAIKDHIGEDLDKIVAGNSIKNQNEKSVSIGISHSTCIPAQKHKYITQENGQGTVSIKESALFYDDTLSAISPGVVGIEATSLEVLVHPQPKICLQYNKDGAITTSTGNYVASSTQYTDDVVGVLDSGIDNEDVISSFANGNSLVLGLKEQVTNGNAFVVANTLISFFGKQIWSMEMDIVITALEGTTDSDDVPFRWMGTPDGFNIDLHNKQYRGYLSALPTKWVMCSSSLDIESEIVSCTFIEYPVFS